MTVTLRFECSGGASDATAYVAGASSARTRVRIKPAPSLVRSEGGKGRLSRTRKNRTAAVGIAGSHMGRAGGLIRIVLARTYVHRLSFH